MAAKPKFDYDFPAKIKVRPYVFQSVIKTCSEPRKATPELKALFARAKDLIKSN